MSNCQIRFPRVFLIINKFCLEYYPKMNHDKSFLESLSINDSNIIFEENSENYERISKIKYLDLSFNSLDFIPDKLKKLSCLE
jgi:hypothetical protein